eukprot:TRINITY_DN148_c0_g1_i1.p1 TRINITY_DN148_c0_g1~~TRINITY_DN148_c0_g1_i1.p1  ORF type:complete len:737 (-),score=56.70 TRINITY_DN148_c0_g1_i1:534-2702(-)
MSPLGVFAFCIFFAAVSADLLNVTEVLRGTLASNVAFSSLALLVDGKGITNTHASLDDTATTKNIGSTEGCITITSDRSAVFRFAEPVRVETISVTHAWFDNGYSSSCWDKWTDGDYNPLSSITWTGKTLAVWGAGGAPATVSGSFGRNLWQSSPSKDGKADLTAILDTPLDPVEEIQVDFSPLQTNNNPSTGMVICEVRFSGRATEKALSTMACLPPGNNYLTPPADMASNWSCEESKFMRGLASQHMSFCTPTCPSDHQAYPPKGFRCLGGYWDTPTIPKCIPSYCDLGPWVFAPERNIDYAKPCKYTELANYRILPDGGECTINCRPGYRHASPNFRFYCGIDRLSGTMQLHPLGENRFKCRRESTNPCEDSFPVHGCSAEPLGVQATQTRTYEDNFLATDEEYCKHTFCKDAFAEYGAGCCTGRSVPNGQYPRVTCSYFAHSRGPSEPTDFSKFKQFASFTAFMCMPEGVRTDVPPINLTGARSGSILALGDRAERAKRHAMVAQDELTISSFREDTYCSTDGCPSASDASDIAAAATELCGGVCEVIVLCETPCPGGNMVRIVYIFSEGNDLEAAGERITTANLAPQSRAATTYAVSTSGTYSVQSTSGGSAAAFCPSLVVAESSSKSKKGLLGLLGLLLIIPCVIICAAIVFLLICARKRARGKDNALALRNVSPFEVTPMMLPSMHVTHTHLAVPVPAPATVTPTCTSGAVWVGC